MAKPVHLPNGREFKTQTAAIEHFRAILHAYENGSIIRDPAHRDDLVALLERYDAAITDTPSKIGVGIERFERRLNAESGYSTPGFWVVRSDGSATDFSFYTGVKGEPKPQSQEFADACRAAVAKDLRAAKKRHFELHGDAQGCVHCELTDEAITIDQAHLDHAYPTFGVMVVMFRAAQGWHEEIPAGILTPSQDMQTTTTFANAEIAAKFRETHHRGARLRMIKTKANLSLAAKQRMPKIRRPVEI